MARIGRVPASGDRGDDRALVMAAQAGDRGALDRLLHRHQDRIYAVCRRLAGNDADGLDAAQEALIAIVRGLPRFDRRSRFTTWAYRVATNAALDELRRRRRRPEPVLDGIDNGPGGRAGRPGRDPIRARVGPGGGGPDRPRLRPGRAAR